MPTLYVVATPIGNLEDVSLRALRTLREVKLIAAEDTRKTRRLLKSHDIRTPLTSYYEHNKMIKLDYIMDCLKDGDLALVSEAGTPGIADPGYELIRAAHERGVQVVAIPGPSAVTTAVAASGLPTDRFLYLGFPPRRGSARKRFLAEIKDEPATLVILEAPHRILATLEDIQEILGDRQIAVCRELTKIYEEIFRGRVSQALKHFTEPRGEFTLVISGMEKLESPSPGEDVIERLSGLRRDGIPAREAISRLSGETGLTRRELYRAWLKTRN